MENETANEVELESESAFDQRVEAHIDKHGESLRKEYEEHVSLLQDSWTHKNYMLDSDACFKEWVAEQLGDR